MVASLRIGCLATVRFFSVVGPIFSNGLQEEVQGVPQLSMLRKTCKTVLFERAFEGQ